MNQNETTPALPPLYSGWIEDLLSGPISGEPGATCNDCPMCKPPQTGNDVVFNVNTKCCTYNPDIPNFLAGAILRDVECPGRSILLQRIQSPAVLRPQGVYPSLAEDAAHSLWNPGFGKDESMLCPFYLKDAGGLCGIWTHRNGRCSTWFCKHERGRIGRDFWRTLRELLSAVERSVSLWCIHQLNAGSAGFRALFPIQVEQNLERFQEQQNFLHRSALSSEFITTKEQRALQDEMWGRWLDREQAFYLACDRLVSTLSWKQVSTIGGDSILNHAHRLQHAFDELKSTELPETLRVAKFHSLPLSQDLVRVWAYSNYDPIDLPTGIVNALPEFDGRKNSNIIESVKSKFGVELSRLVIQQLYDFEILKDTTEEPWT